MDKTQNTEKKLRIGILIRDVERLGNWEFRILKRIIEHPHLDLVVFFKDGRKHTSSLRSRLKRSLFAPLKTLTNVLYALQMKVEAVLYKPKPTVDADDIINKTKNIETICLTPEKKGFVDFFSKEEAEKVKTYDLDIILRHEFNIIRGDILEAARYGIWSYHHADNAINRGLPPGFWEIFNNEPCCGVTLQQLTSELDGGLVIDKAWFNWDWPFSKTSYELLEKSVVLLFKNIDKLLREGKIETKKSLTYYNTLYKQPNLKCLLQYMARYYLNIFTRIPEKFFPMKRLNCWALFIGKGNFLESTLFRINPITMPKTEFWADPFLYRHDNQLYAFFENYSYETKKGKISSGKVIESEKGIYSIVDVRDALNVDYHLSYPQIFAEDGEIFLMPETCQSRRLEIYRSVQFPEKWELYATAFDGEEIVDTTYFRDESGNRWLLLNKGLEPCEAELYVYQIDSLKLENIIAHKLNPVLMDCRKARSGGAIFKHENEYYRPSQINTHGMYGKGLQINKIKKLTLEEFEDEAVISINPNFRKGLVGVHHLHQLEGYFVFDACFKKM